MIKIYVYILYKYMYILYDIVYLFNIIYMSSDECLPFHSSHQVAGDSNSVGAADEADDAKSRSRVVATR